MNLIKKPAQFYKYLYNLEKYVQNDTLIYIHNL